MGAGVLGELYVEVGLKSTEMEEGFERIKLRAEHWKSEMKASFSGVGEAFTSLVTVAVGTAAAISAVFTATLAEAAKEGIEFGAEISKMSDKTGIAIDALMGMKVGAEEAGASLESVTRSTMLLERAIADANDTTTASHRIFEKLGLDLDAVRNLAPDKALGVVADALNKVTDAGERTSMSQHLLGRGALELSGYLRQGSEGMAETAEHARALGLAMSGLDAENIRKAEAAFNDLKNIVLGVSLAFAEELAPVIRGTADYLQDVGHESGSLKTVFRDMIMDGIEGVGVLLDYWQRFRIVIQSVKTTVLELATGVNVVADIVMRAFVWMGQIVNNFGTLVGAVINVQTTSWDLVGTSIKMAFTKAFDYVAVKMIQFIQDSGSLLPGLGFAIGGIAEKLKKDFTDSSKAASAEFDTAMGHVEDAADDAWDAMNNLFDTDVKENESVKFLDNNIAILAPLMRAAQADLEKLLNTGISTSAFDAWKAKVMKIFEDVDRKKAGEKDDYDSVMGDDTKSKKPDMSDNDKKLLLDKRIAQEKELQSVRDHLAKKVELEQKSYEKSKEIIDRSLEDRQISTDDANALYMDLEERHYQDQEQAEREDIKQRLNIQFQGYQDAAHGLGTALGQMSSLMNTHNRTMFEIGKAAAYANTIVNTAEAAMLAFKNGCEINVYVGAAYAAAAIAAGAVQLAAISSASFGGSGGGGGGATSAGGAVPPSAGGTGAQPVYGSGQTGPAKQINIQLQGDSMYSPSAIRNLIDSINSQLGSGAVIGSLRAT